MRVMGDHCSLGETHCVNSPFLQKCEVCVNHLLVVVWEWLASEKALCSYCVKKRVNVAGPDGTERWDLDAARGRREDESGECRGMRKVGRHDVAAGEEFSRVPDGKRNHLIGSMASGSKVHFSWQTVPGR